VVVDALDTKGRTAVDYRTLFASKDYLGVADLQGREHTVTLDAVRIEAVQGDNGSEQKLVATFRGASKRLILNKTNADFLATLAGSADTDHWAGRAVVLFTTATTYMGRPTQGIRLRAAAPTAPVAPVAPVAAPVQPAVFAPVPPSTAALGSPVLGGPAADDDIPF
jgi:hypothetical protein